MDNLLFRSYSINIIGSLEDNEKISELSNDILYLYQVYWYYLLIFITLDKVNDILKEKFNFFSKFNYLFPELKYEYFDYDNLEILSKYLEDDDYRFLSVIKDNEISQLDDDTIERIHDLLFDGIFICRTLYNQEVNIIQNIFIPDNSILHICQKYKKKINQGESNELESKFGKYWKQYWLLESFNPTTKINIQNLKPPYWNYLIIPPNCNSLLLREIILNKLGITNSNYYIWCYSNPLVYFNKLQLKEFNFCKNNPIVTEYNFRDNIHISEQIRHLYTKDLLETEIPEKKEIVKLFNQEIFKFNQTVPLSIKLKNQDYLIKGNPILDNNIRDLSNEIIINENIIELSIPIGNSFFFYFKRTFRKYFK